MFSWSKQSQRETGATERSPRSTTRPVLSASSFFRVTSSHRAHRVDDLQACSTAPSSTKAFSSRTSSWNILPISFDNHTCSDKLSGRVGFVPSFGFVYRHLHLCLVRATPPLSLLPRFDLLQVADHRITSDLKLQLPNSQTSLLIRAAKPTTELSHREHILAASCAQHMQINKSSSPVGCSRRGRYPSSSASSQYSITLARFSSKSSRHQNLLHYSILFRQSPCRAPSSSTEK